MCGIFGFVARDPRMTPDEAGCGAATAAIRHRGPDDDGVLVTAGAVIASRRLAILDLSAAGHMPMTTPDGRYSICHNGEIYNFAQLRRELEAEGHTFRSQTDTEVLLQLYASRGPDMLLKLNGMFAFAIWDARERRLFAARDPLGVKPLVYAETAEGLLFASEHKALFAAGVDPELDQTAWEELLCFRFVAGPRTPFRNVQRLLPGHYLTYEAGSLRIHQWWDLAARAKERRADLPADLQSWYRESLLESVKLRTISDVPLGVLLSGGLDSSAIAAGLARAAGSGMSTFTVRFPETDFDEGEFAKLVAVRWSLDYRELFVSPDCLLDTLMQAAWFNDEPNAHGSDPHVLSIARYAKPSVTVLLSGEGADETLGGYVRYEPLKYPGLFKTLRAVGPILERLPGDRVAKLGRFTGLKSIEDFVLFDACDVLPHDTACVGLQPAAEFEYRRTVLAKAAALHPGEFKRQAMFLDQHTYLASLLDRNDRMTMGASIECRVPFLDRTIVEMLAAVPAERLFGPRPKHLLREAMKRDLPSGVLSHKKWGFGVPWDSYLRERNDFREALSQVWQSAVFGGSPIDRTRVRVLIDAYLGGANTHKALVKQLFMLSVWHESYLKRVRRQTPGPRLAVA